MAITVTKGQTSTSEPNCSLPIHQLQVVAKGKKKKEPNAAMPRCFPNNHRWRRARNDLGTVVEAMKATGLSLDLGTTLISDPGRALSPPCIVIYLPDGYSESYLKPRTSFPL